MHKQIIFARIGCGELYRGEDLTGNFADRSWGERFNFTPGPRGRCYAYLPPLGAHESPPNPDCKEGWLVVFCSKPNSEEPLRSVGWYENATLNGYDERPKHPSLPRSKWALWNQTPYNLSTKAVDAYLIPSENRRLSPPVPTERFRRSYIYARVNGTAKDRKLADIAEQIAASKKTAKRIGGPDIEPKLNEKERHDLLRKLFEQEVNDMLNAENLSPDAARNRVIASILQRSGQVRFRSRLLRAYGGICAISDSDCPEALEAAHIQRYAEGGKDQITNGLLLRADLHRLFDRGKISIDPVTCTVIVARELKATVYRSLHGAPLKPPSNPSHRPKLPGSPT